MSDRQTAALSDGEADGGERRQREGREELRPWVLESKNANKNTLHSLKRQPHYG